MFVLQASLVHFTLIQLRQKSEMRNKFVYFVKPAQLALRKSVLQNAFFPFGYSLREIVQSECGSSIKGRGEARFAFRVQLGYFFTSCELSLIEMRRRYRMRAHLGESWHSQFFSSPGRWDDHLPEA